MHIEARIDKMGKNSSTEPLKVSDDIASKGKQAQKFAYGKSNVHFMSDMPKLGVTRSLWPQKAALQTYYGRYSVCEQLKNLPAAAVVDHKHLTTAAPGKQILFPQNLDNFAFGNHCASNRILEK